MNQGFRAPQGNDSLSHRSTDTWIYDEHLDAGQLDTIPQAEADRLAEDAAALLRAVEALARYPRPATRSFHNPEAPALIAWASIVDLATDRRLAVWTDDPVLRAVVRQSGIPATQRCSTISPTSASSPPNNTRTLSAP